MKHCHHKNSVLSLWISVYVSDFNGLSVYGGLTRIGVIMIWFYFLMVCLMVCAEINYVYHDRIKVFTVAKFKRNVKYTCFFYRNLLQYSVEKLTDRTKTSGVLERNRI